MARTRRAIWLAALLGLIIIVPQAAAEYSVTVGIKQTDGRWKDTLLAGETNILEVTITNEGPVAAYAIPLNFSTETSGAFAYPDPVNLTYVNRMATPGNPFTIRPVNTDSIDGLPPNDRILFGAVEFGFNYLTPGTGVIIEQEVHVDPFVGSVRIDSLFFPPAGVFGFSDTLGADIENVLFHPSFPVFPVVLRNPNDGPTCVTPPDIDSPFGSPLSAIITGNDTEGDPLSFSQISGPGSTSGAGSWSWTPGCSDVGTYEVCVTVSDANHIDWDTCCFTVAVTQTAPSLTCDDQVVHYDTDLSYFLNGTDDGCLNALQYFQTSGPGSLNPSTGEFIWTPGCGDVGLHFVDAGVTDGQDTALCTFQVTVTNSAPVISCPANFFSGAGDTVNLQIATSDADGDALTYTLLGFTKLFGPTGGGPNFPATLSATGLFNWPTSDVNDDDFGVWEVSLRVDEICDSDFCTFEIEITPNRMPVCQPPSDLFIRWDKGPATAQFIFSDPDGDAITFSQVSGPGSMDAGGLWSWSVGCAEVGVYEICAVVADSAFPGGDTCCFMLTVTQSPPGLNCRDTSIHVGTGPLVVDFSTTDDGCPGAPVRYYLISGPGDIDSITGLYALTPSTPGFGCKETGDFEVTLYATDSELADTCTFTASIVNSPPIITCPLDTLRHSTAKLFTHATLVVDPDGDTIETVFIRNFDRVAGPPGGPNNAPTMDAEGVVSWLTDPGNDNDLGTWRMILEARDPCDISRCTLFVNVLHNTPPTCLSGNTAGHVGDTAYGAALGLDVDGDTLTFTQISGPGSIITAENVGRWSWVSECADVGVYEVCMTVSDGVVANADTCCFEVIIFQNAPVISCSTQTVHYGDTLVYNIPFEDDACPDVAVWSLISGPGHLNTTTGQYTLPTECGDLGTVSVTVALDDTNGADTCTFDVNITNTQPFVDCPADEPGLKVGLTVDRDIDFGDADGDAATIALVSFQKLGGMNGNPPNNAPTLSGAGHFNWVTDDLNVDDVATWEVTVRVDEPCDSNFCSFRIEILPNEAPICTAPGDTSIICLSLSSRTFTSSDVEGDAVTYTQISGPGSTDTSTGVWNWTPPCDSGGLYEVCVAVSDRLHTDADTCCFMLSMCAVGVPGDVDGDGGANSGDIIIIVNFIFKSAAMPFGAYTADMNCNGLTTSQDIIKLVNYVFKSGPAPCLACDSPLFPGL